MLFMIKYQILLCPFHIFIQLEGVEKNIYSSNPELYLIPFVSLTFSSQILLLSIVFAIVENWECSGRTDPIELLPVNSVVDCDIFHTKWPQEMEHIHQKMKLLVVSLTKSYFHLK